MKQIFVFIFFALAIVGCNKSVECEKEIYLIPDGFSGKIIVYFDQSDGDPVEYKNNARIYHIPKSGYLKSQFQKNGGCMNDKRIRFFYEDGTEIGEELDYFLDMDKDSIQTIDRDFVLFTLLSSENKPHFVVHLVGNISEFNHLMEEVKHLEPVNILESI